MPEIPQFSFPLRVEDNQFVTVEQDSSTDIAQRIHLLVLTPPEFLDSLPDFGLGDQAHLQGGADADEIERQIELHIPVEGLALAVEEDLASLNAALGVVDIRIGD